MSVVIISEGLVGHNLEAAAEFPAPGAVKAGEDAFLDVSVHEWVDVDDEVALLEVVYEKFDFLGEGVGEEN